MMNRKYTSCGSGGLTATKLVQGSEPVKLTCFNRLMFWAASFTTRMAEASFPSPPCVEVTTEVRLVRVPALTPVTSTEKVQEALPARLASLRLTI